MLITIDWLRQRNACKEGIVWYERNFKQPIDLEKVEIIGDYDSYFDWIKDVLKHEYKYDDRNNRTKEIYPNGNIIQHNAQGNLTELYRDNIKILQIKYKD